MSGHVEGGYETEATLVICSETTEEVAGQIAAVTSLDGYSLLPAPDEEIRDVSFDTPGRELRARGLALRVRTMDSLMLVTLKGPPQAVGWGAVKRMELEAPWSGDAITRTLDELERRGVALNHRRRVPYDSDPFGVMMGLGLEEVQDRHTRRLVRRILPEGREDAPVLAELDIDHVTYHLPDRHVRHYEVEIEAKVNDGTEVIKAVSGHLQAVFGSGLRSWDHSKLSTGLAISELLGRERPAGLLSNHDAIAPAAYDVVEEFLRPKAGS